MNEDEDLEKKKRINCGGYFKNIVAVLTAINKMYDALKNVVYFAATRKIVAVYN